MESQHHDLRPNLFLFGPQALSFSRESLGKLRSTLHDNPSHRWIIETVNELHVCWDVVTSSIPRLCSLPADKLLKDLATWLTNGIGQLPQHGDLPNVLLTPLVVIMQLTQYWRHLELHSRSCDQDLQAAVVCQDVETLGFCTGLLSAYAVSSSATREEFERYGAVAIRLAILVGATVDALDLSDRTYGPAKSFATAWHHDQQRREMALIMELFPETYLPVLYDERKATITTSERAAPVLLQRLRSAGITAAEVGLRGRFHCPEHSEMVGRLVELCDTKSAFQFNDASKLALPSYTNNGGEPISGGSMHEHALRAILVDQSDWYGTFTAMKTRRLDKRAGGQIISFGPDRCVPPTLVRSLGPRVLRFATLDEDMPQLLASIIDPEGHVPSTSRARPGTDRDIAIIGMSIKVAGADDLDEFSEILRAGKSQHEQVPIARMTFDTLHRGKDERKWYGNFIRDIDAFDSKFFKRSPRESATMDPQQRLYLQAAYQAVEQSGYFTLPQPDKHIGSYLGACAGDYEHNIACHPANAFTATGNLKSFIPGKVSHYFGWTGPSMTFDTACSASTVAIHTAIRAMMAGECSAALCGGVATIGNPLWFQNLAGASFLSPTGQCKPFDEAADGYCRAEGIACVFLKPLSSAIADGNQIFGCISGTAVYQNQNCTPLFVPNTPSLSQLFRDVIQQAGMEPQDISFVEAHGTGTPVGDPVEYQSIREVLGGPIRSKLLPIGSVKGFIGHTEGASGVISLIKVAVTMQEGYIPPQASHSQMSHHIDARTSDMMEVPTRLRPWDEGYKAALINNYGASGSNASMVVTQAPRRGQPSDRAYHGTKQIFWITGVDKRSISDYCARILPFVEKKSTTTKLADFSFNICRQSNRSFTHGLIFTCASVPELSETLSLATTLTIEIKPVRPVILCFGGQVSTFVGLDYNLYGSVQILRNHLGRCNAVIQSLGLESIFPDIFSNAPVSDTVKLQTMLFAMQYSCARCWMDCGAKVEAVVGHSFGEITALCVSGVLSLEDAVKLVAGRAEVVRDMWGPDSGSMMAVEGDLNVVEELLAEANNAYNGNHPAGIACYNGPRSFTLAGSTEAIKSVAETISSRTAFSQIRGKKLNVTNAFHSSLVEPLVPSLDRLGRDLTFNNPTIRLERATKARVPAPKLTSSFVANHMQNAVFFHDAVRRLASDYPSAIWLEAGSASTITTMARRALESPPDSHFQGVNLINDRGMEGLVDATASLWKEGLRVSFWAHHGLQTHEYSPLLLPPYQFEKIRHWLEFKTPPIIPVEPQIKSEPPQKLGLWTFVGYQDDPNNKCPRFRINTESDEYKDFVLGHVVAQTAPICPATLEVDMAIEALFSIRPDFSAQKLQPVLLAMHNHAPICVDPTRPVWLEFKATDSECRVWAWKIFSTSPDVRTGETLCAAAKLQFRSPEEQEYRSEFSRFERLVNHRICLDILQDDDADDIMQGRTVYRTFAEVVDYGEIYRGVRKVVGRGEECAGVVRTEHVTKTWLDVPLSDSFSQVSGMWVNCMTDRAPTDMFIATGCELSMRSPKVSGDYPRPETWHVLARHHRESEKAFLADVFVFDSTDGLLVEVIMGIQYTRVSKGSMSKILSRLTTDQSVLREASRILGKADVIAGSACTDIPPSQDVVRANDEGEKTTGICRRDISRDLRIVIANVSGIEAGEILDDSELADLGIDSLMGMELTREVESAFECSLDQAEFFEATSFRKFVACVSAALYGPDADEDGESSAGKGGDIFSEDFNGHSTDESVRSLATNEPTTNAETAAAVAGSKLKLSQSDILASFGEVKALTDQAIKDHGLDSIDGVIIARSNRLCVALVLEAFEQLGCPLRTAAPGQQLQRISHRPEHGRLVEFLYAFLANDARLIDTSGSQITRSSIPAPRKTSDALFQEVLQAHPEFNVANKLTYYAGRSLADVLTGKTDGIKLLFGSVEGRELVQALYCDHSFNRMNYEQMRDVIQHVAKKLPADDGPLKILEMGAGTGGTTHVLAPFLASLDLPFEYTFTDLSASMVAQARRKFKSYPFMKFAVHDIERPPAEELCGQHIVIASNAVHATRDLKVSAANIYSALRPDGFLMLLEMTEVVPFIDLIFGLLEGWWLFGDGRRHAIVPATHWERDLRAGGFQHIDWTDGRLPENEFQRVIIALASGPPQERLPLPAPTCISNAASESTAREEKAEQYVTRYSAGFSAPIFPEKTAGFAQDDGSCVIITGATGSLGSHLAAHFAERPDIQTVVCLNRRRNTPAAVRQQQAFASRGITLSAIAQVKIRALETDMSVAKLGLPDDEYAWLRHRGTQIVHNAWPMSGTRPINAFEPQFRALRNLIDLAREIACHRGAGFRVGFQLVSSIGVVGRYPLWSGETRVPEERVRMESVLPIGYCEAKWTCERILDETLHQCPDSFRPMVVRLGQIAGSRTSGYWNPAEHFPFLVKSAQSLGAFPDFDGVLQWVPVNEVAGTLADLCMAHGRTFPVYHVDNPVGQPWKNMAKILAEELDIPPGNMIPFKRWVQRVRRSPLNADTDNPAARLSDFLDDHFVRMSCGGLILDTVKAREHSTTLAAQGPVPDDVARKYVRAWKTMGFLYS